MTFGQSGCGGQTIEHLVALEMIECVVRPDPVIPGSVRADRADDAAIQVIPHRERCERAHFPDQQAVARAGQQTSVIGPRADAQHRIAPGLVILNGQLAVDYFASVEIDHAQTVLVADPQRSVFIFKDRVRLFARQSFGPAKVDEGSIVQHLQTLGRGDPKIALTIFAEAGHLVAEQACFGGVGIRSDMNTDGDPAKTLANRADPQSPGFVFQHSAHQRACQGQARMELVVLSHPTDPRVA